MGSNNDVAVITGAASGIGRATAEALAARGSHVCVCDCNFDGAREVCSALEARGGSASSWDMDVSDSVKVAQVFEDIRRQVGEVTTLVTSAGVPGHGELVDVSDDLWEKVMRNNLYGTFYCMREALKQMLPMRRGVIVNISSICGMMGCSSSPTYSAAKAGTIGLSKAYARRHTRDGIRINVVAPGLVDTPLIEPDRRMGKLAKGIEKIPMGRMGTAEEIAELVAFLCSDAAAFIAGQVISPNGGQVI